ncbi:hypothetical protein RKQ66_18055 [Acinetobacter baumannii]|uniref:hypothetical protein n=1 Tax=Acinetobacter baumannii TaxID=470 RepID=UPI00355AFB71
MDIQKEREAFENHLKKMGKTDNETFSKNEDDSYQMDIIHFGWKIWQAAKAQAVPGWIETAIQPPEEGQKVIISGIYGVGIAEFSYLYKDEFVMYDMGASNPILSKDQVKFWQPLPDAPQELVND